MSSVTGLDKRLQEVLIRPEFLEMRGGQGGADLHSDLQPRR